MMPNLTDFGREGACVVILWGLAYLSVCVHYDVAPYILLAFGIEKAFFVWTYFYFFFKKDGWRVIKEEVHLYSRFLLSV